MGGLRSALLDEPLHRAVTREAESGLSYFGSWILHPVAVELLESLVSQGGYSRILFSPHEALHLFPLHLTPFRDGILADHFTVTVLPSLECLFSGSRAAEAKAGGVSVVACAAGGLGVGLPEEPSLHEQAERIAGLFGSRPLTGDNATPDAALDVLGAARYLHLAAHGVPDHDAPLFSRVYLAGGQLHAYEVLERDLRGVELVTLSACESALLRYDFFDNLHGLVPAFLRAGARAVVGALWPVEPDVAVTFFGELYAHLAAGVDQVAAFRAAQNTARERHPNYRDWGGFSYFGR
ncbi:CHAT domain-containing protein [Pseudonocardia adelaidensis]